MASDKSNTYNKINKLPKELGIIEVIILALQATVGTGVFFATLSSTVIAGPASVISWLIAGLMFLIVVLNVADLTIKFPEAGAPARFSAYTHGDFTNLINSVANLIWYLFIPPIEALATVEALNYLYPKFITQTGYPSLLGALVGVLLVIVFGIINYMGSRFLGRFSVIFGIIKLSVYIIIVSVFLILLFNINNFSINKGFLPYGISSVFLAVPVTLFSFGFSRVIADYAEEIKDISLVFKIYFGTVIFNIIITILYDFAFIGAINWSKLGLPSGCWNDLISIHTNPFILFAEGYPLLLLLVIITATIGPSGEGYIYLGAGSRVLFSMARSKYVNSTFEAIHVKYKIPYKAIIAFTLLGSVITFISAPLPNIYSLMTDAVVGGYLGYAFATISQGSLTYNNKKFKAILSYLGFIVASLILYWSGWPALPYGILLVSILTVIFSIMYKVYSNIKNSIWAIVFMLWLTILTYIGSVGALNIIQFYIGNILNIIVSTLIYLWGIKSAINMN